MTGLRSVGSLVIRTTLALVLIPAAALAQNTGIAGVVRDSAGLVMPGVTAEVASPALIEKTRSVVTDAQGRYSIVDLRPGTYTVTFTVPGFTTVRREGIDLVGSFTATVNADMKVGAVEETLTVTGQAPLVDTRNVVQTKVLDDEIREALPTGRNQLYMATLIPGTTRTANAGKVRDLAGTSDTRGSTMIHGGRSSDYMLFYDGTSTDLGGGGSQSWQSDPGEVQEFVYALGALSAENPFGGVAANIVPKDGGNRYAGKFFSAFTGGKHLQSNNLNQALRDLEVIAPVTLDDHWDVNFSSGGPVLRDRVWFFGSYRNQGNDEQIVGMFEAINPKSVVFNPKLGAAGNVDLSKPAKYPTRNYYYSGRVTWQATPKNKFALYYSDQTRHNYLRSVSGTVAVESGQNQEWGGHLFGLHGGGCGKDEGCGFAGLVQASWKSPLSSRILLEANVGYSPLHGCICAPFGKQAHTYAGPDVVAIVDSVTGYTYRSSSATYSPTQRYDHDSAKAAVSYVTGAHTAKAGFDTDWGEITSYGVFHNGQNMTFRFQDGVPNQITIFNEPYDQSTGRWHRLGLFAQDQWTIKRFTVNGGLRFDYQNSSIPAWQTSGPNQYAAKQQWPAVKDVPNWKDLSPRFGVAYDLFGTGKTALKYTLSRYVTNDGSSFPSSVNPITFNRSATRPWNDKTACAGGISNDFVPQDCELGTLSNSAFGTAATTTTVDDAIRKGWGVRQYDWETSVSIQHELIRQLSVNLAYTRRWFHNFTVTDNLALAQTDYDEYCVTAPSDARLGSVSGTRICGLYDLNPAARTRTPNNLRTTSDNYGTQKESWQGVDLTMNARFGRATLQGGMSFGPLTNNTEACFAIDSPQAMRYCKTSLPWQKNTRFLGSIDLPWGINLGATFVSDPNVEIQAQYTVTNADITAGRVQFVNPARTTFSGGNATVNLLEPGTKYQSYINSVDVRLGKSFSYRNLKARFTLDLANVTNVSTVLEASSTYGGAGSVWPRPSNVMPGRLVKPGLQVEW